MFVRMIDRIAHEAKCDGTHSMQCQVCLKVFGTKQGKWKHTQYVKCNSPSQVINNITNNNFNNTNITNTNITNNNIINIDFGKECLKKLCNDETYISNILENLKLEKYAIPKSIEDIYFNDKYPENQTLKKDRRNDKLVSIKYKGKWETRIFDDISKDLIKKTEEYHDKYFTNLQRQYENTDKNREFRKLMLPLRHFANKMTWIGWHCNEIRKLGIPLDEEIDEDDFKNILAYQKEVENLMIDKIISKSDSI